MAKLGEANVGGRLAPAWLLNLTAEELDSLKSLWYSNPNLLDNWYFGNPVNQRGKTEYVSAGYTIDRWVVSESTLVVEDGYISVDLTNWKGILQYIEPNLFKKLAGKTLTASVMHNDGQLKSVTFTPSQDWTKVDLWVGTEMGTIIYRWSEGRPNFTYANTQIGDLLAFKLELGDQQTLAHQENGVWVLNEIPDYTEELLKCMTSKADSADTYANCELSPKMDDLGNYDGYKSIDKYNGLPVVYKNFQGFLLWGTGSKESGADYFDSMGRAIRFSASAGGSVTIPLLPNRVYLVSSSNNVGNCLAVVVTAGSIVSSISHLLQASGVSISVGSGLSIVVTDTDGRYGRVVSVMML